MTTIRSAEYKAKDWLAEGGVQRELFSAQIPCSLGKIKGISRLRMDPTRIGARKIAFWRDSCASRPKSEQGPTRLRKGNGTSLLSVCSFDFRTLQVRIASHCLPRVRVRLYFTYAWAHKPLGRNHPLLIADLANTPALPASRNSAPSIRPKKSISPATRPVQPV